jgi:hypothetical protein
MYEKYQISKNLKLKKKYMYFFKKRKKKKEKRKKKKEKRKKKMKGGLRGGVAYEPPPAYGVAVRPP